MPKDNRQYHLQRALVALVALALVGGMLLLDPIAQPPGYHVFADRRSWFGIPNTLNVLSNIPFALVGALGLLACGGDDAGEIAMFRAIFAGIFCTAFGSAYYHWQPDNHSLVWDRVPMTVAFMGFFVYVLSSRIDRKLTLLLWPLCMLGVASVLYWGWTETLGTGDLRWYLLVQFGPVILIPLILMLIPGAAGELRYYIGLLVCYGLAKLLEYFDRSVWEMAQIISGHTLKHLAAALGAWFILLMLRQRQRMVSL